MNCPKCGSSTHLCNYGVSVDGVVVYRKLKCDSCERIFYTAEIEVLLNDSIREAFLSERKDGKRTAESRWVKVRCVDTGEIFESISIAAGLYGINRAAITNCCKGKRKTAGGFRWEYYKENEKENEEC